MTWLLPRQYGKGVRINEAPGQDLIWLGLLPSLSTGVKWGGKDEWLSMGRLKKIMFYLVLEGEDMQPKWSQADLILFNLHCSLVACTWEQAPSLPLWLEVLLIIAGARLRLQSQQCDGYSFSVFLWYIKPSPLADKYSALSFTFFFSWCWGLSEYSLC